MTFEAGIHGIDLNKEEKENSDEGWLCVDPKDYEHLSKEEREALTKERISKFNKQVNT